MVKTYKYRIYPIVPEPGSGTIGEKVSNPRHLRRAELKLILHNFCICDSGAIDKNCGVLRKQRRVSKRKKGSHRREKLVNELAKQHELVANQRRDFHFKTAHSLFSRYDAVVVENLEIQNLVKNHHLAKSISDSPSAHTTSLRAGTIAAWGNFVLALGSKAENAGCHLLKVPPHGTSQKCSDLPSRRLVVSAKGDQCSEVVKKSLAETPFVAP